MELPERIKCWREHVGLTKTELAQKLELHMESVLQWEDGSTTPTTKNLQKLVEAFGVSMAEFYGATKKQLPKAKAAS